MRDRGSNEKYVKNCLGYWALEFEIYL